MTLQTTEKLDEAYLALLAAVGGAAPTLGGRNFTSHWPLLGREFDKGVLVVGQAVYGWISDWTASEVLTDEDRGAVLDDTQRLLSGRPDAMDWISGHRVENSPFWRTAHEVVDAITPGPSAWYCRVAWANLYPIAPNDKKGNPEGRLREVQTEPAAAFLASVVDELRPRLVLVLAGPYIWPFVVPLRLESLSRAEAPFSLVGRRDGVPWIAGMHPGGAQRRGWPARQYAELIVEKALALGV